VQIRDIAHIDKARVDLRTARHAIHQVLSLIAGLLVMRQMSGLPALADAKSKAVARSWHRSSRC
jgi:hypothetical protein